MNFMARLLLKDCVMRLLPSATRGRVGGCNGEVSGVSVSHIKAVCLVVLYLSTRFFFAHLERFYGTEKRFIWIPDKKTKVVQPAGMAQPVVQ